MNSSDASLAEEFTRVQYFGHIGCEKTGGGCVASIVGCGCCKATSRGPVIQKRWGIK